MRHTILFVAMMICPSIAIADIFQWLGLSSGPKIACDLDDRACLVPTIEDLIFAEAANREVKENTRFTLDLALLHHKLNRTEQEQLRARLESSGEGEEVMSNFDRNIEKVRPPKFVDIQTLRSTLETEQAPEGGDFHEITLFAFAGLLGGPDTDEALDLWDQHRNLIWNKAWNAYRLIQRYIAENDVPRFVTYTDTYRLSGLNGERVWDILSLIATNHCKWGDPENGRLVTRQLLTQYEKYGPDQELINLYAQGALYEPILLCLGEDAAQAWHSKIIEFFPAVSDYIQSEHPDKQQRTFALYSVRETINKQTVEVLAGYLLDQGRTEEAREAFENADPTPTAMSFTLDGDNIEVEIGPQAYTWEDFLSFREDLTMYRAPAEAALVDFLENYDGSGERTYGVFHDLEYYVNHVSEVWPAEVAVEASLKIQTVAKETLIADAEPEQSRHNFDQLILTLATLPQPIVCHLGNDDREKIFQNLRNYYFSDEVARTSLAYIDYVDATAHPAETGPCALQLPAY